MIRLVIMGHGDPVKLIINSLDKNIFKVVNVQQDRIRAGKEQDTFCDFLNSQNILINKINLNKGDFDLILSVNYYKIIDINQYLQHKLINLHIGLLPKYRGNNANAWAVINGEKRVGYTLHEITNILDGGDIFYTFEYEIGNDVTYFNAKKAINHDISTNISQIIHSIYNKQIAPKSQKGAGFTYCLKLKPSDGIISDWNISTDTLIKMYYVFGKPMGTGLDFKYKDSFYKIDKISLIEGYLPSVGKPGSIVYIFENCLWVKTMDTAVKISGIRSNNILINVNEIFKMGIRL